MTEQGWIWLNMTMTEYECNDQIRLNMNNMTKYSWIWLHINEND